MRATVLYSDDFRLHSPEPYTHPESPERLDHALRGVELSRGPVEPVIKEPGAGDRRLYLEVHSPGYLERIWRLAESGSVEWLDPDTYVSTGTPRAVERLAGAASEAVELAGAGQGPVLVLGRPPGHHAGEKGPALGAPTLGFCIVNTSALLAVLLRRSGRVLVVDFDAHHGNGTQEILWDAPIMHVDIHQDPSTIYPGTGWPWQTGESREHPKANIVVPPGSGDDIYRAAARAVEALIEWYGPDYIVVSAGFDAFEGDAPFTGLRAREPAYTALGEVLRPYKERLVVMLEGGYTIGLERGLAAFLRGLAGRPTEGEPSLSSEGARRAFVSWLRRLEEALGLELPTPEWARS